MILTRLIQNPSGVLSEMREINSHNFMEKTFTGRDGPVTPGV